MLKRFAFRRKMYYLCTSEEERARNTGFFPLFFAHYKGKNTSEVGILYAFADFLNALAEIFLALSVREMTM